MEPKDTIPCLLTMKRLPCFFFLPDMHVRETQCFQSVTCLYLLHHCLVLFFSSAKAFKRWMNTITKHLTNPCDYEDKNRTTQLRRTQCVQSVTYLYIYISSNHLLLSFYLPKHSCAGGRLTKKTLKHFRERPVNCVNTYSSLSFCTVATTFQRTMW